MIINENELGFFQRDNAHAYKYALGHYIPHLLVWNPEPLKNFNWGYAENRRTLCRSEIENRALMVYTRDTKIESEHNLIYCERCWRRWHALRGVETPKQKRPDPLEGWVEEPVAEVIEIDTGKRYMPYKIYRDQKTGYAWAFSDHDLKDNGAPRLYHSGHILASATTQSRFAIYKPELSEAYNETQAEIERLKRELYAAQKHLRELYQEE